MFSGLSKPEYTLDAHCTDLGKLIRNLYSKFPISLPRPVMQKLKKIKTRCTFFYFFKTNSKIQKRKIEINHAVRKENWVLHSPTVCKIVSKY